MVACTRHSPVVDVLVVMSMIVCIIMPVCLFHYFTLASLPLLIMGATQ